MRNKCLRRMKSWAEKSSQTFWPQLWAFGLGSPKCYILAAIIALISWVVYLNIEATFYNTTKSGLKADAKKLLDGGLKPEDERKAVEILLALNTDYAPPQTRFDPIFPPWWVIVSATMMGLCILLSFPPRTTIALGTGRQLVPRIRRRTAVINWLLVWVLIAGIGVAVVVKVVFSYIGW